MDGALSQVDVPQYRIDLGVATVGQLGLTARALRLRLAPCGGPPDALHDLVCMARRDLDRLRQMTDLDHQ